MGESAEDLPPADPELGEVDRLRRVRVSLSWGELAEGTVRPGIVMGKQAAYLRSAPRTFSGIRFRLASWAGQAAAGSIER